MDALTRENALNIAKNLSLPNVVLDIMDDKVPDSLIDYFSTPMVFDLSGEEQEEYGFGKILPLWSSANGDVIFAYDFMRNDYFSFVWDGDIKARFSTWNDLLKETVSRVMDIVWDDQTEDEVLEVLKEVFDGFEVDDMDSIFRSIIRQK
ncbi:hypothetical protein KCM76_10055 [Zooshikella marina]|uniref:hypothetical protein n=1 Tax=Zooshikella ganghwensis TaxID=202772 RepID=UPI001BAFA65C|nr:hypothetical protein [Zooshikella ganghwensis]MBU2706331.1 hypothetical protein [Zooshikella ganghwensis]